MSPRRIGLLLWKEIAHGSKGFLFILAVLMPLVLTLVVSGLFGSLFADKPRLGIAGEGSARVVGLASAMDTVAVKTYDSDSELRAAVAAGASDMGIFVPSGFDQQVTSGRAAALQAYVWGESLLSDRAILGTTVASVVRALAGQEVPLEIRTAVVGTLQNVPWKDRFMPLIVLIAVILGGILVPASSLVEEKAKRTLTALVTTPVSLGEVLVAKGILGVLLGVVTGTLSLLLNRAFGNQPGLLILLIALGASLASAFGVLMGTIAKDLNSLFAINKAIGILYYAPALIFLVPSIPRWIGRIFPTYYIIGPIVEVSQRGAGLADVAPDLIVLAALVVALIVLTGLVARRAARREQLA